MPWRRSLMVKDRSGNWACPQDQPGEDTVSLSEGNAAGAMEHRQWSTTEDGGHDGI